MKLFLLESARLTRTASACVYALGMLLLSSPALAEGPVAIVLARSTAYGAPAGTHSERARPAKGPDVKRLEPAKAGPERTEELTLTKVPGAPLGRVPAYLYYRPRPPGGREQDPKPHTSGAMDFELPTVVKGAASGRGAAAVGAAFATHVVLHELGHDVVADYVGARGATLDFLTTSNGQFFFASSKVKSIEPRSRLPYSMGGELAADLAFEYALASYRANPGLYNTSLMLFSGMDLLVYSVYAFYFSTGHGHLDPIAVTEEHNISREALLSVALAKTALNAWRIHSGEDRVIPHFTVDRESVVFNLTVPY